MRKIIITRGAAGSGKSTAIAKLGLSDYCLSSDAVRLLHSSPAMTSTGKMGIPQDNSHRVWEMVNAFLDEKTNRGEFIVLDSTHVKRADFMRVYNFAKRRRYEVACLDFSHIPLDTLHAQNMNRSEYKQVPDHVVEQMYNALTWDPPQDVKMFSWNEPSVQNEVLKWMEEKVHDLSDFNDIIHVGDIQGCFTPLAEKGGLFEQGLRDDAFYIFVGDLLDRGPQNGEVLQWALEELVPRDNVVIIWGNHEDHLVRWAYGEEGRSDEFLKRTLPQVEAKGIKPEDVRPLVGKLQECFFYVYDDKSVMVTHGGLSTIPQYPVFISSHQYSHGTGYWKDPVDSQFENQAPEGWYQVHGHRNHGNVKLTKDRRSFNLEDSVEFGGCLRALRLNEDGFHPIQIRNPNYVPLRNRQNTRYVLPSWIKNDDEKGIYIEPSAWQQMKNHQILGKKALRFKENELFPHITSVNFSRHVFYKSAWDDVAVRARGLFVNAYTLEVAARSYEKFFNIGEREETQAHALRDSMAYPVNVYIKENGYLGILGYDSKTDNLIFASKSTTDGFFAENFERIAKNTLGESILEGIKRYLRDAECSFVFEVIDPRNDPHIIEYREEGVVLLDVFRRSLNTEKLNYQDLKKVAKTFGLKPKEYKLTINTPEQFEGWLKHVEKPDYKDNAGHLEGFVLEDSKAFQTKIKLFYYAYWKTMRSVKDKVRSAMEKGEPLSSIQPDLNHAYRGRFWQQPDAIPFLEFCKEQTPEFLEQDIISLKREFDEWEARMKLEETNDVNDSHAEMRVK